MQIQDIVPNRLRFTYVENRRTPVHRYRSGITGNNSSDSIDFHVEMAQQILGFPQFFPIDKAMLNTIHKSTMICKQSSINHRKN